MPAPAAYTESGLAQFMLGELQHVGRGLGWVTQAQIQPAIDEALLDLGVTDVATVTGADAIRRLRAVARVHVWRLAAQATAGDFDFQADGGRYDRSQVHKHCVDMVKRAEADAERIGAGVGADQYRVGVDTVNNIHDPYVMLDDDEAVLP